MSFALLVGISTHVQGDVGFSIGILYGRCGSGGVVPLGLYGGTLFIVRNTGLAPFPVPYFCPDLAFAVCLVMAALRSCVGGFIWYVLCRQSLKNNPIISYRRQACSGWFCTLCPENLISSSVYLIFHSISVDSFVIFILCFLWPFFLEVCLL